MISWPRTFKNSYVLIAFLFADYLPLTTLYVSPYLSRDTIPLLMFSVHRAAGSFTAFYVVVRATTDDGTAMMVTNTFYSVSKQHTIS